MHTNFWVKKTDFKLFGKTIFTKEEVCNDKNFDATEIQFIVTSSDYYKSEFEVKKKNDDNNNR